MPRLGRAMDGGAKSLLTWMVPFAVLAAAAGLLFSDAGGYSTRLAQAEFAAYQQVQPRPYAETAGQSGFSVRVLDIDADSVARFGPWPWPHDVLARLCQELEQAGAAVVVLAFPLPASTDTATAAANGTNRTISPATAFATALSAVKSVTGFELGKQGLREPTLKGEIRLDSADEGPAVPDFATAAGAPAPFEQASAGIGALNWPQEGAQGGLPLLFRWNGRLVPSLDAETFRVVTGASALSLERSAGDGSPLDPPSMRLTAGSSAVPLTPKGILEVYFSGTSQDRLISATSLDSGTLAQGSLKNTVVYIAPPDERYATPVGPENMGEIRAEAMENILLGTSLRLAPSLPAQLGFLALAGGILVLLFARGRLFWAGAVAVVAIAAAQSFSWFLFTGNHVLFDSANASAALAVAAVAGFSMQALQRAQRRSRVNQSFAGALSVNAVQEIAHRRGQPIPAGEARLVTSLSCGVRRSEELARSFGDDAANFIRVLNLAMAPLVDDVIEHGGMIGRFDGVSFCAHWNAPLDDPKHAVQACEAAGRMVATLATVNERLSQDSRRDGQPIDTIEIGIGISTGVAAAGTFHSRARSSYCVVGETPSLAERIRLLSDRYGPAVILSEATRDAAKRGYALLEVDYIALEPNEDPVRLYALLGNPLVRASPKFKAVATFHEHIFQTLRSQQWSKARGLIEQCRKLSGVSQKFYDLHLARIAWFEEHPPGPDWDGVFRPLA